MENQFYTTFPSPFKSFTVVWRGKGSNLQVQRIFLSDKNHTSEAKILDLLPNIKSKSISVIKILGEKIQKFLNGEKIEIGLEVLDFNMCYEIQKKVLLAEYEIPRGWVSSYKRIAQIIGIPKGARVVGNALAKNPFPIIIPCHRAIKTNGELGGYQGGINMKRVLLEMEGIEFSDKGKVITDRIYY